MFVEYAIKMARIRITHSLGDFIDAQTAVFQQPLGLGNAGFSEDLNEVFASLNFKNTANIA